MRNIWKILFITLLCLLLVGSAAFGIALTNFLHGSGLHFLGSSAQISTLQTCYFIDPNTNEIIGSGELHATGYSFEGSFCGIINIDAYPLEPEDMTHFSFRRSDKNWVCFSSYDIVQSADFLNKEWVRYYDVWVCRQRFVSQPKAIIVEIYEYNKPRVIAVCAKSEEEALANYDTYYDAYKEYRIH